MFHRANKEIKNLEHSSKIDTFLQFKISLCKKALIKQRKLKIWEGCQNFVHKQGQKAVIT